MFLKQTNKTLEDSCMETMIWIVNKRIVSELAKPRREQSYYQNVGSLYIQQLSNFIELASREVTHFHWISGMFWEELCIVPKVTTCTLTMLSSMLHVFHISWEWRFNIIVKWGLALCVSNVRLRTRRTFTCGILNPATGAFTQSAVTHVHLN